MRNFEVLHVFQFRTSTSLTLENVTLREIANNDVAALRCSGDVSLRNITITDFSYTNFMALSLAPARFDVARLAVHRNSFVGLLLSRTANDSAATSSIFLRDANVTSESELELIANVVDIGRLTLQATLRVTARAVRVVESLLIAPEAFFTNQRLTGPAARDGSHLVRPSISFVARSVVASDTRIVGCGLNYSPIFKLDFKP